MSVWKHFHRTAFVLFSLLVAIAINPVQAQLTEATLKGVVKDPSGNVLVSAPVVAKNEDTEQARSAVTDGSGTFVMAGLQPGMYRVSISASGFKTFERSGLILNVGQATELNIRMDIGRVEERVEVQADEVQVPVSTEGRLADTFARLQISELPLPQRDVFSLPSLSVGATAIPGAATSTKLTNSPVVTVNGNRYRGNNYVLDGSMDTNPNNTGEPAIVPSLESVEEAQVQTGNFSSEFGRGNAAVINLRTKSGTNDFHGRLWEYHRNSAVNARNYFAKQDVPLVFNQFGGNLGGPIFKNKTFFFLSYESTHKAFGQALSFEVETPEFRDFVFNTNPNGVAASLLRAHPSPAAPLPGVNGKKYAGQVNLPAPNDSIPAIGTANFILGDYAQFDQYLIRIDHSFNDDKDKLTARWISEYQQDQGGISAQRATQGKAVRGYLGPFNGLFSNMNLGHIHVFNRAVNDFRFSFQNISTYVGINNPVVPDISITGVTLGFGEIPKNGTELRTYELRDTLSMNRGKHLLRMGVELRKIFKGLSIAPPTPGSFSFSNILSFASDAPFKQTLTVDPFTGNATGFPRYFTLYETGLFFQDDWKITSRLNLSLGLRHDYFGTATERDGRLSSIILGPGSDFHQQLAGASIGRVNHLYHPERLNFSPRIGLAYDPFGDGRSSIRSGFSIAYQPHHGQSITGARALPPDAIQGVLQPSVGIGSHIAYGIPVPFNPEFATGLNSHGGLPCVGTGVPCIRITGFVVNPVIKTQYSESWFLNVERQFAANWVVELGYIGTNGINLERIEDVNRFSGDLRDGKFDGVNPNFGPLLFVSNGVTSRYNAMTAEVRHNFGHGLNLKVNYRWSKWLDTGSDTSTGQFLDNSEPGKGAENVDCLRCERAPSMFDIPRRLTGSIVWTPMLWKRGGLGAKLANHWEVSTVINAQSGRPFSVWNGAPANLECVSGSNIVKPGAGASCQNGFTLQNLGGDFNLDNGGGAVGGGFYDRPNIPAPGTIKTSFSNHDFLTGLFKATDFPAPAIGKDGTLGRNSFRGPHQVNADVAVARSFSLREGTSLQARMEAFNVLNKVNLPLPIADLSNSSFGKSTQAFDPRILQGSLKLTF